MSENKVAVITGGSDGIGRELCMVYGLNGYKVVFTGRNLEKITATTADLQSKGITAHGYVLDAGSALDNQMLIDRAILDYGRIDVLICNAGISMRILFEEIELTHFHQIMNTNFMGCVSLVKAALPHLKTSRGTIIGISSINGRRATPARTAYAASKYAMEGFLESLRMELKPHQIHVMVVCPGFTASNMRQSALMKDGQQQGTTKLNEKKMMPARVVAQKTYKAMRHKKRDLILTTQGKAAVWANKFLPGWMDQIVFRVMSKKPDSPFYKS